MSNTGYPVILTNGTRLGGGNYEVLDVSQVANSIADTSVTSLSLPRRGAKGYSETMSENIVHLLENFNDSTAPENPLTGQIWYNNGAQQLQFYNGSQFLPIDNGLASGLAQPITLGLVDANTNFNMGSVQFTGAADVNISVTLSPTGVVAGTYNTPSLTIGADGRITSASASQLSASTISSALGYTPANDALVVHKSGDNMTGQLNSTGGFNAQSPGTIQENGNTLLPRGAVILWTGSTAPAGWALCNGANGTPNLSGMFVVGIGSDPAGNNYTLGAQGGAAYLSAPTGTGGGHSHTMDTQGSHSHTGSTNPTTLDQTMIPSHTHSFGTSQNITTGTPTTYSSGGDNKVYDNPTGASTGSTGGGLPHSHGIGTDGAHYHNIAAVGDHTHLVNIDNRAPYYALAYIMKL